MASGDQRPIGDDQRGAPGTCGTRERAKAGETRRDGSRHWSCPSSTSTGRAGGTMIVLTIVLVFFGLIFPFFSAVTGLLYWKRGAGWSESPSPIFVPFFGPSLLTCAILLNSYPWWLIPTVWVTDLGTLVFLRYLPAIIREERKVSRFTRVLRIKGSVENAHAVLTFHTSGKYLLQKRWKLAQGEQGIVGMGELGTYAETLDGFTMKSDEVVDRRVVHERSVFRIDRKLVRTAGRAVVVEESDLPEVVSYHTLRNWSLHE